MYRGALQRGGIPPPASTIARNAPISPYNGCMKPSEHPFSALTPDFVLDALDTVGMRGDGRLLALNSYENRVYLAGVEDAKPVVVKFYRPDRWSDAAILEEHGFSRELAEAEVPAVAPLAFEGRTLNPCGGLRFAVFPLRGGRAPELDDPDVLEWIGRFLGRIHAVGMQGHFEARPTLDIAGFGHGPRAWLLENAGIPSFLREAYETVSAQALDGVARSFERAGDVASMRLHGDCRIVIGCQHTIVSRNACH